MSFTVLLQKLLAIEESIGKESNKSVRLAVQDAQFYLLQLQKERAESLQSARTPHMSKPASFAA